MASDLGTGRLTRYVELPSSSQSRPDLIAAPADNRAESLVLAPLGELGIQRRYSSLGSGGQQVSVHLMRDVDVPVP
jgi:hypothetical protein